MTWAEVCENPYLRNLPFKIELNEWGQILMSPASNDHGWYQTLIGAKLLLLSGSGRTVSECSIQTTKGVRVADVAWASAAFVASHQGETPFTQAPEVCVEIQSPSKTLGEIKEKTQLYFAAGAKEVWLCKNGKMAFHSPNGSLPCSGIFPTFPMEVGIVGQ